MKRKAIIPDELKSFYEDWKMSPGHLSGDHVFLSGFTGANPDGTVSDDPEVQIRTAFEKIGYVLRESGLGFDALVEMTTYHVGLKDHQELVKSIRAEYVQEPYPAWTAIEVSGFVREGAVIEIKAIARL